GAGVVASRDSVATEVTRWTHGFRLLTSAATGSGLVGSLPCRMTRTYTAREPVQSSSVCGLFSEAGSFVTCTPGCPRYTPAMRVLIDGCGYVGLPLGAELVKQGHDVIRLRRTQDADA